MKKNDRLLQSIGYQFKEIDLLQQALSHRSIGSHNNERLEYLGDSLLNFIIAEALFKKFPRAKEGDLSRLRAFLVQGATLAEIAAEFDLGEYLLLGEGELKSGGFRRTSIQSDAIEALIGAIYRDSNFETCRATVLAWFAARLDSITLENTDKDPKTRLQEYLQEKKRPLPNYVVIETLGEAHAKQFVIECRLQDEALMTQGCSSSKRAAEKLAAEKMLAMIEQAPKPIPG